MFFFIHRCIDALVSTGRLVVKAQRFRFLKPFKVKSYIILDIVFIQMLFEVSKVCDKSENKLNLTLYNFYNIPTIFFIIFKILYIKSKKIKLSISKLMITIQEQILSHYQRFLNFYFFIFLNLWISEFLDFWIFEIF